MQRLKSTPDAPKLQPIEVTFRECYSHRSCQPLTADTQRRGRMILVVITAGAMAFSFFAFVKYREGLPAHRMLELDQAQAERYNRRCNKCGSVVPLVIL